MTRYLLAVALLAALLMAKGVIPASAASDLLRCQARDAITFGQDGTLRRTEATKVWATDSYVIDLAGGSIRMGGLAPVPWFVAQEGNENSDTVLVPAKPGATEFNKFDLVNTTQDFIRVRQWGSPTLFTRFSFPILVTGTCEPVR